jgi:hypothetical protein
MGPLLAYRDDEHLDRMLEATSGSNIEVLRDKVSRSSAFWFRRGRGLVHGSCLRTVSSVPVMYFSFGHPFNPFLWPSDGRLLREIERTFLANGSSSVDAKTLA